MAHLNWHGKIVEVWRKPETNFRYHITETNKVMRTTGPRSGNAKFSKLTLQAVKDLVMVKNWIREF